jgi:hypothetical protein
MTVSGSQAPKYEGHRVQSGRTMRDWFNCPRRVSGSALASLL